MTHLDAIPVDVEKHEVVKPSAFDDAVAHAKAKVKEFEEKNRNSYERVREFMEAFGHPVYDKPTDIEDADWLHMRLELIREELGELYEACGYETSEWNEVVPVRQMDRMNIVAVADALGDLEYVVNGMALGTGIDLPEVVREIHRSNMTKLGADGKPIYREDGKILKGPGYEPPNLLKPLGLS
jgi:predicted HAD superfamily Cof-like phosphohydrolase